MGDKLDSERTLKDRMQHLSRMQWDAKQNSREFSSKYTLKDANIFTRDLKFICSKSESYKDYVLEKTIKTIIEECKEKLVKLIWEENELSKDEIEAGRQIEELRERIPRIENSLDTIHNFCGMLQNIPNLSQLKELMDKDVKITEAMEVLADALKKLSKKLVKKI